MNYTTEQNEKLWNEEYNWINEGEEWGDGEQIFYKSSLNKFSDSKSILDFLGFEKDFYFETILEIAPGHGRMTKNLLNHCKNLIGVDLAEKCVNHCKKRFPNGKFYKNDGKSLNMIDDNTIDFIFTYDSLVHADNTVLETYLKESSRILKKDGIGFFHYSNFLDVKDDYNSNHFRNITMSNKLFIEYTNNYNLEIIKNNILNWGEDINSDCFTIIKK